MKDLLLRLRAALTPQALLVLALMLLALGGMNVFRSPHEHEDIERRASRMLSAVQGAGDVEVVIQMRQITAQGDTFHSQMQEIPCGAVAVAQGADDPIVRMQLEQALCALLGLPASSVSIVMGGKGG